MSMIVQCELLALGDEPDTDRHLVTWLEAGKVRPGNTVVLKDMPGVIWHVRSVGHPHERSDIKRGWGMTDFMGPVPKAGS